MRASADSIAVPSQRAARFDRALPPHRQTRLASTAPCPGSESPGRVRHRATSARPRRAVPARRRDRPSDRRRRRGSSADRLPARRRRAHRRERHLMRSSRSATSRSAELPLGESDHPLQARPFGIVQRSVPTSSARLLVDSTRVGVDVIAQLRHAHPRESVHCRRRYRRGSSQVPPRKFRHGRAHLVTMIGCQRMTRPHRARPPSSGTTRRR